jgi:hypothetical protein
MVGILSLLFVVSALFLGLCSHDMHCYVMNDLLGIECPPHFINLILSIFFFVVAVIIAQESYLKNVYNAIQNITQTAGKLAGKLAKTTAKVAIKASKNLNDIDQLANRIENFVDSNDFKILK